MKVAHQMKTRKEKGRREEEGNRKWATDVRQRGKKLCWRSKSKVSRSKRGWSGVVSDAAERKDKAGVQVKNESNRHEVPAGATQPRYGARAVRIILLEKKKTDEERSVCVS